MDRSVTPAFTLALCQRALAERELRPLAVAITQALIEWVPATAAHVCRRDDDQWRVLAGSPSPGELAGHAVDRPSVTATDVGWSASWPLRTAQGAIAAIGARGVGCCDQARVDAHLEAAAEILAAWLARTQVDEAREAALQSFARRVSHDLQAPARNVGQLAELLAAELGDDGSETARECLHHLIHNANNMQRLVRDLRDYTRFVDVAPRLDDVALDELLDSVLDERVAELQARRVAIQREALPIARADRARLRIVLSHLIDNALKFVADPARIEVTDASDDEAITVVVRDNGPGVPASLRSRAFEPFERLTVSSRSAGNGLGLAVCARIVQSHGGALWIDDAEGGGAAVHLRLPRREG
ncbi:MAG: HAMP domain-containing sensor histidine kinase [Nannocystaceae bacterium]|nr:HAMP domain-containing histidine kinase [Myxococcales bacterium]